MMTNLNPIKDGRKTIGYHVPVDYEVLYANKETGKYQAKAIIKLVGKKKSRKHYEAYAGYIDENTWKYLGEFYNLDEATQAINEYCYMDSTLSKQLHQG